MSTIDSVVYLNQLFNTFVNKIIVPTTFRERADAVSIMLQDDVTGLIDSLTDFAVESATVDYGVETNNDTLNKIFKKWITEVNSAYSGKVPPGLKALSTEYFKERWKGASFPVLKITEWADYGGFQLPSKMFFVDGKEITANDKSKNSEITIDSYDYYLGNTNDKKNKLDKGVIFSKPYVRWFAKYPIPYLIKRGVYHNYKIIESIKNFGSRIIEEIIPYMMHVTKGDESLTKAGKTYTDKEFKDVFDDLQNWLREYRNNRGTRDGQTKMRVTDYTEKITQLIPDLTTAFNTKLYEQAEKNLLSGLGFIDIVQSASESRKEAILNPKAFIEETRAGIEDFKLMIYQVILLALKQNSSSIKYKNKTFKVTSSPVRGFINAKFKTELRLLWKHGKLSDQTYCELVGEVDFSLEKNRREREAKDGTEVLMYPHHTDNKESDISPEEEKRHKKIYDEEIDKNGDVIPNDKIDDKERFDMSGTNTKDLEIAPYKQVSELPKSVKDNMSADLQGTFMSVVNQAFETYKSESRAFRIAWGIIRNIARKNKKGMWVRKRKREDGKLVGMKVNESILNEVLQKEEKVAIEESMKARREEIEVTKLKLLKMLVKNKNKE